MTNEQRKFYKILHILFLIAAILPLMAIVMLVIIWTIQPFGNVSQFLLSVGPIEFIVPDDRIQGQMTLSPMFFITMILLLLLFTWLFLVIKDFFKNLTKRKVFIDKNTRNIRLVGLIIIIMAAFKNIPMMFLAKDLLHQINFDPLQFTLNYEFESGLLIAGIAIIAVSIVFNQAVKIAKENELTI